MPRVLQVLSFFKSADTAREHSPKRKFDSGAVKYVPRPETDVTDDVAGKQTFTGQTVNGASETVARKILRLQTCFCFLLFSLLRFILVS